MKMEIFDSNENQASDIGENDGEKDKENIYVSITDLYSHVVAIIRIC